MLFTWGLSLLAFDEARRELFTGAEDGHLVLAAPFFGGAAVAALLAWVGRRLGRAPLGGALAHRFALASGLLAVTALGLLLSLGPRVHEAEAATRDLRARQQVHELALALERYRASVGRYPPVVGVESLAAALVPEHDPGPLPLFDPWGQPVWYQTISEGRGYLLVGLGADGRQSLPEASYLEPDAASRLGDDVVAVSGRMLGVAPSAGSGPRPAGSR